MRKSERALVLQNVEARLFMKEMLDSRDDASDSENEEEYLFYLAIKTKRYLERNVVPKTGQWTPDRK
jgi:hypothetical protein